MRAVRGMVYIKLKENGYTIVVVHLKDFLGMVYIGYLEVVVCLSFPQLGFPMPVRSELELSSSDGPWVLESSVRDRFAIFDTDLIIGIDFTPHSSLFSRFSLPCYLRHGFGFKLG